MHFLNHSDLNWILKLPYKNINIIRNFQAFLLAVFEILCQFTQSFAEITIVITIEITVDFKTFMSIFVILF